KPAERAWKEMTTLLDLANRDDETRLRLRTVLRSVCDAIWLLTVRRGAVTLCAVQLLFAGGAVRSYLFYYRTGNLYRPGEWCVRSWTDRELQKAKMPEQFDLRNANPTMLEQDHDGKATWIAGWKDVEEDLLALEPEDLFRGCERHPLP